MTQVAGPEPTSPRSRLRYAAAIASIAVVVAALAAPIAQVESANARRTPRPTPSPTPPPTCTLVPQLRDVAITQGVGNFTVNVR